MLINIKDIKQNYLTFLRAKHKILTKKLFIWLCLISAKLFFII